MASLVKICDWLCIDAKQQFRMTQRRTGSRPGSEWYILARGKRLYAVDEAAAGLRWDR